MSAPKSIFAPETQPVSTQATHRGRRSKREATAYHEAGHVLAAWTFRIEIKSATIEPGVSFLGQVQHRNLPRRAYENAELGMLSPKQQVDFEHFVIVSFAGLVAETKYRGRRNRVTAGDDYNFITERAMTLIPWERSRNAWLAYCEAAAQDMIEASWPCIEAVAAALLHQGTLTADEISTIMLDDAVRKATFARFRQRHEEEQERAKAALRADVTKEVRTVGRG